MATVANRRSNALRGNLVGALPHLGALAAASVVMAVWLAGSDRVPRPFILIAIVTVFALMMIAPLIGARVVLELRATHPSDRAAMVLRSYRRWAGTGVVAGALWFSAIVFGEGVLSQSLMNWAFVGLIATSWLVPIVVPLVRFLRWLLRPPRGLAAHQTR